MIIRSLVLRHGRRALAKPPPPVHSWRRYLASEVDEPYTNSFEDQQYVENGIGGTKSQAINVLPTRQQPATSDDQVALDWAFFNHQERVTANVGSLMTPFYQPHKLLHNPYSPKDITLELLLASQSHMGHSTALWNPANARYIFGIRDGTHIISLDATAAHLRRACKVVSGVTARGGLVLFVGTRENQDRIVVKAAELAGGCHLFERWIPGSITNGQQILGPCAKKVVDEFDIEVPGFEKQLIDRAAIKPDLVVCLNPLENYVLLHECALNNIPTVGVIDTDANPTWVTYPIPANDDSLRCTYLVAGVLGRAGQEGKDFRLARARRGIVDFVSAHGLSAPEKVRAQTQEKRRMPKSTHEREAAPPPSPPATQLESAMNQRTRDKDVHNVRRQRGKEMLRPLDDEELSMPATEGGTEQQVSEDDLRLLEAEPEALSRGGDAEQLSTTAVEGDAEQQALEDDLLLSDEADAHFNKAVADQQASETVWTSPEEAEASFYDVHSGEEEYPSLKSAAQELEQDEDENRAVENPFLVEIAEERIQAPRSSAFGLSDVSKPSEANQQPQHTLTPAETLESASEEELDSRFAAEDAQALWETTAAGRGENPILGRTRREALQIVQERQANATRGLRRGK